MLFKWKTRRKKVLETLKKLIYRDVKKEMSYPLLLTMDPKLRSGLRNAISKTYLLLHILLKDKTGNSLLYFCVVGNIDGQDIRIEENWRSEIEVKTDQVRIATIKANEFTFKTTIRTEGNICESSLLFAVIVLMYFMYKIYK